MSARPVGQNNSGSYHLPHLRMHNQQYFSFTSLFTLHYHTHSMRAYMQGPYPVTLSHSGLGLSLTSKGTINPFVPALSDLWYFSTIRKEKRGLAPELQSYKLFSKIRQ